MNLSQIEISKKDLIHNINQFREKLPDGNKIASVVKANAYGHGVEQVVSVTEDMVDYFQVDDLEELIEIRKYTNKPVLVFGYVAKDQLEEFVKYDAILGLYDLEIAKKINEFSKPKSAKADGQEKTRVHIKVDAMLGRQGIMVDETKEFFEELKKLEHLEVESIYSHFSNIEDVDNLDHAEKQHDLLLKSKEIAISVGFKNLNHHISATSGFMTDMKNNWGGNILRLGIGMYGLWPSDDLRNKLSDEIKLKPVMRWVTHIAQVKELPAGFAIGYGCTHVTKKPTKIAVIPQGYSDGYDRKFSNNSNVLINGQRCPVLGRIAMNMFVVDVTDIEKVKAEDEVVLLGKQGNEEITADELARQNETINYEIPTRVLSKLPRVIT